MKTLVVIPARGGSKGLPKKNTKKLFGKPLIQYTIEIARELFLDIDICVSTDSVEIKECVEQTGLKVPFLRPEDLATDRSGTYEVLLHAIQFYEAMNCNYDNVLLLQPTTPFRNKDHIKEMILIMTDKPETEMVVSVKESKDNPYFNLFEESSDGFLKKSKEISFDRRQDCPKVYAYNGSVYLISIPALKTSKLSDFNKVIKYLMLEDIYNIDIDVQKDWWMAEKMWSEFNMNID